MKNTLVSKELDNEPPQCRIVCSIILDKVDKVFCTLCSPPDDSKYRYETADFEEQLHSLLRSTPLIVCGDMKLLQKTGTRYANLRATNKISLIYLITT